MFRLFATQIETPRQLRDSSGQDMIEFALLAALVGIVVATLIPTLTNAIAAEFSTIEGLL